MEFLISVDLGKVWPPLTHTPTTPTPYMYQQTIYGWSQQGLY